MQNFETFEHKADTGVRGFGETMEESFENAAQAMFSVMVDLEKATPDKEVEVECQAADKEGLLLEWLNTLLAEADLEGLIFSDFEVEISENNLKGIARGEKINFKKHQLKTEVKAATYSELEVTEENGRWVAQCIVDV